MPYFVKIIIGMHKAVRSPLVPLLIELYSTKYIDIISFDYCQVQGGSLSTTVLAYQGGCALDTPGPLSRYVCALRHLTRDRANVVSSPPSENVLHITNSGVGRS